MTGHGCRCLLPHHLPTKCWSCAGTSLLRTEQGQGASQHAHRVRRMHSGRPDLERRALAWPSPAMKSTSWCIDTCRKAVGAASWCVCLPWHEGSMHGVEFSWVSSGRFWVRLRRPRGYPFCYAAGFSHSAFVFGYESFVHKSNISGNDVPPGALISFLQKGLQYLELEANLNEVSALHFHTSNPHPLPHVVVSCCCCACTASLRSLRHCPCAREAASQKWSALYHQEAVQALDEAVFCTMMRHCAHQKEGME